MSDAALAISMIGVTSCTRPLIMTAEAIMRLLNDQKYNPKLGLNKYVPINCQELPVAAWGLFENTSQSHASSHQPTCESIQLSNATNFVRFLNERIMMTAAKAWSTARTNTRYIFLRYNVPPLPLFAPCSPISQDSRGVVQVCSDRRGARDVERSFRSIAVTCS
jgi:hypothetical protein